MLQEYTHPSQLLSLAQDDVQCLNDIDELTKEVALARLLLLTSKLDPFIITEIRESWIRAIAHVYGISY